MPTVWSDIKERQLEIVESMLDSLFRACAANGSGLPAAIEIFRDAKRLGLASAQVRDTRPLTAERRSPVQLPAALPAQSAPHVVPLPPPVAPRSTMW